MSVVSKTSDNKIGSCRINYPVDSVCLWGIRPPCKIYSGQVWHPTVKCTLIDEAYSCITCSSIL